MTAQKSMQVSENASDPKVVLELAALSLYFRGKCIERDFGKMSVGGI